MESIRNPLPKPPKYIDVDYMTLPDIDSNPLFYNEDTQEITAYWTDGKMVYWYFDRASRDVEHFVWFNRLFAKDSKHCFLHGHKLRNVDHASFTALNNCCERLSSIAVPDSVIEIGEDAFAGCNNLTM